MSRSIAIGLVSGCMLLIGACASKAPPETAVSNGRETVFEAERAFAVTAQIKGAKQSFLSVLAEDSIVFNAAGAVPGIARYTVAPESNFSLMWWPAEGDGSAAGDLFYSTGPYVVAADGKDRGFGQYMSVWQRQADGELKLLADHGISLLPEQVSAQHDAFAASYASVRRGEPEDAATCTGTLEAADAALNAGEAQATPGVLMRNNTLATAGPVVAAHGGLETRRAAKAASGDLAMTAGDGPAAAEGEGAATYLRIWRKSDCEWRVLIDVES
jgi:ketosteroid isomerase-like protein